MALDIARRIAPWQSMRLMDQGNRMNAVIMIRKRLSFRPSPDKGRTGGVCSGEIGFLV
jgi:hypothetical protein